ncbi:MAG: DUF6452 family protein [Paludibacteraceae bacterium]|nr:DUF6452 family protein [Paludibacteraceae bacterium]
MKKLIGFIAAAFLIALMACTNNCYVPTRALLGVAFMDSAQLKPVTVKQLTIKGEGNDSILYNASSEQSVFLPLHQNQTVTRFDMSFLRHKEDTVPTAYTLEVKHQPYPQLISEECGCVMFHSIDTATCYNAQESLRVEIYSTNVINVEGDVQLKISL